MAKKVAVLAVNPVNGFGLFQYLEAFFENGISNNSICSGRHERDQNEFRHRSCS